VARGGRLPRLTYPDGSRWPNLNLRAGHGV